jgi:hypothetical protein
MIHEGSPGRPFFELDSLAFAEELCIAGESLKKERALFGGSLIIAPQVVRQFTKGEFR